VSSPFSVDRKGGTVHHGQLTTDHGQEVTPMNSILLILLGVALGIAIGWLVAAARTRTELVKSQVDAEGRVKAAEGTLLEVRARIGALQTSLDERARDLGELQQKLREEGEQKVKAQTELENARTAAG